MQDNDLSVWARAGPFQLHVQVQVERVRAAAKVELQQVRLRGHPVRQEGVREPEGMERLYLRVYLPQRLLLSFVFEVRPWILHLQVIISSLSMLKSEYSGGIIVQTNRDTR